MSSLVSLLISKPVLSDYVPTLMTSFNLIFLEASSPNTAKLGVQASTDNFLEDTNTQSVTGPMELEPKYLRNAATQWLLVSLSMKEIPFCTKIQILGTSTILNLCWCLWKNVMNMVLQVSKNY